MSHLALCAPLSTAETRRLLDWRRHLHAEPELSFGEHDTAAYVERALLSLAIGPVFTLGGLGKVAVLGPARGPALMLRADMDALPVDEKSGLPFASKRPGVMHACGHDAHTAVLLAVAGRLKVHEAELPRPVVLCFQPAEEVGQGAAKMIGDGLLDGRYAEAAPHVEKALGLHVWSRHPTGHVIATPGPFMATVDDFTVTVRGRGGHGAMPQDCADAIVAAAAVVQALQTLASRRADPLDPVVVTVGSIHGGRAFNVIAEEVELRGTCRSYSQALGDQLPAWVREVSEAAARAHGCTATVDYKRHAIALGNDPGLCATVRQAAQGVGSVTGVSAGYRLMGGEDFAWYAAKVPACFFFVGCGGKDGKGAPHHSPRFRIDEAALPTAAEVMLRSAALVLGLVL
jgi:amidohydrolase